MLYLANPCGSDAVATAMSTGQLGYIDTPRQGNARPNGVAWCADNGCYSDAWDAARWWAFLVKNADRTDSCLFAVAPDVVGDAAATIERSAPWFDRIRKLGYPVAFVAQNGQEDLPVPWDEFDVLFIGGDTEWKLGPAARQLAAEAKRRGKRLHMGRVNTKRRLQYAREIGCDTVDGTTLTRGPDRNLPPLLSWLAEIDTQGLLGGVSA